MDSLFIILTVTAGAALLRLKMYVRFAHADLNREGQATVASCFGLSIGGGYAALIGVGRAVDGTRPVPVVLALIVGGAGAAYLGAKVLTPTVVTATVFKKIEPMGAISAVEARVALLATSSVIEDAILRPATASNVSSADGRRAFGEVHLPAPRCPRGPGRTPRSNPVLGRPQVKPSP